MSAGVLSIIVSVFALLVTFSNFYFSHLRKKRDLRAVVVDAGYISDANDVYLDIVFINGGTQQELVSGVALDFFKMPRPELGGFLDISDVMPFMVRPDPIVLSPKSKSLKRYRFHLVKEKLEATRASLAANNSISCRIKFKVMDADGFTYTRSFSRGSMGRRDCPISFGFVTDDLLPLERESFDISQLTLDKKRFAEYRRYPLHPIAIMRWAYHWMRAPRVKLERRKPEKVV